MREHYTLLNRDGEIVGFFHGTPAKVLELCLHRDLTHRPWRKGDFLLQPS